ncbi:MAG: hypothetical protein Ct9H300mP8_06690 [Gammaproteobacteria bacterium]|nr:MAG: hypothetical protein Ct9H300mP8_06690 [Gammaproteobacteria bacterium]
MRLFPFSPHQRESLRAGVWLRFFGEARLNRSGLEMVILNIGFSVQNRAPSSQN